MKKNKVGSHLDLSELDGMDARSRESFSTLALIELAKILELPRDKTIADLKVHAKLLMTKLRGKLTKLEKLNK